MTTEIITQRSWRRRQLILRWICLCTAVAVLACNGNKAASESTGTPLPRGKAEYQKLTKEAYQLKKDGHNGKALAVLKEAIKLTEPHSTIYGSALDDQASVLVRIGKYKEAEEMFSESIRVLEDTAAPAALTNGVKNRLNLLKKMKAMGIQCAEPEAPSANAELPYYPNIREYQNTLGSLTREVASCHDSNIIEPMMTRMVISGDGRLISARALDKFAGTDTEKCVVTRLEANIDKLPLEPFSACFRGFTFPFMLGKHPNLDVSDSVPPKNGEDGDSGSQQQQTPPENASKGEIPSSDSALTGARNLLDGYVSDNVEKAMSFFFPADAFNIVKDSPNPARYHRKLVDWYKEDFDQERKRFSTGDWKVDDISLGTCKWKAPGTEANKVGYWSCSRNSVSVSSNGQKRRFEIHVLINWGQTWYVTHLGPVRK